MFVKILRWICGYVLVHITGENTAQFLNYCIKKNLHIWNVKNNNSELVLYMLVSDYKNIRKIRRDSKYTVKISHEKLLGFPRKIIFFVKRRSLLLGMALFFAVIISMSRFVWEIDIVGNKSISDEQIESAYSELGVRKGMLKSNLESYKLRDRLPLIVREVSWCSFNLEGSVLTINITEVSETDKSNKEYYSNLIASSDGIIESINTTSGKSICAIGQVVKKGELLVSGANEYNPNGFTYSQGEIFAKTRRKITVDIKKNQEIFNRTGKLSKRKIVDIYGFKIPLYIDTIHYNNVSKISSRGFNLFGKELPIKIIERNFEEIYGQQMSLNEVDANNEALSNLLFELKKIGAKGVKIIEKNVSETDSSFHFEFVCECVENIAVIQKLNIAETN